MPLTTAERRGLLTIGVGFVLLFVLATFVTPDPRGFGTHEQLGLPACWFRRATGVSCPHCGLTTSFAWWVRGEWTLAWNSNPSGILLAGLLTGLTPWLILMGSLRRSPGRISPWRWLSGLLVTWLILSLIVWISRHW